MPHETQKSSATFLAQCLAMFEYNLAATIVASLETGVLLYANPAFEKMLGIMQVDALGKNTVELGIISPEEREFIRAKVIAQGSLRGLPVNMHTKHGTVVEVLLATDIVEIDGGRYFLSSMIDITDLQLNEESAAQLAAIVKYSDNAIITKSLDGIIQSWNAGAEKIFGFAAEQAIGQPISLIVPDDYLLEEQMILARISNSEAVDHFETIRRRKSGERFYVSLTVSPLKDKMGRITGISKIARDITDQKQAAYARNLIEASLDPLVTISAAGKITDVNAASVKVTGMSRGKLIGTDFSDYFTEPSKAQAGYQEAFNAGFVSDYPLTIRHIDGTLTDVMYNAAVYKDDKGVVLGVFAAARDVTEQKWAIDLRIANKELAFQNDEKEKRAAELAIANEELSFQNDEKEKRAAELAIANQELSFQNEEKEKRAAELVLANVELAFQNDQKEKRAAELVIANEELSFQNDEKEKRAAELVLANVELTFESEEKEKRAAELVIANQELTYQNEEKEKRAAELAVANAELIFQHSEKEKRAAELVIANIELAFQNDEKGKRVAELRVANYARGLIEASLDPLVTINAAGKITDLNKATTTVTGVAREVLIGSDFFDYFTEPQMAREVYQEVFAAGSVADSPLTLRSIDGRLVDVLFNGSVYKDDMGLVQGVVIVARDVTESKRIAANLEKSLQEISGYKLALDESSIVSIADRRGIITYVNDNFCTISKYSRAEILGQDHRIVNSGYHPHTFMQDLWKTITSGKIWTGEIKNKAKDGVIYWVDSTIVPFRNETGEIYQYVSIRSDITAKKLLLQYSMSLIEASRDPLVTISPEGKITDMNEAMVTVTGRSRESLRGSDFQNYFTDPDKATAIYQEVFAKGFVADYPLTIMDGKLTDVLFNGSVYKDDTGTVVGAVIVARDITEQNRVQKELTEAIVYAELATKLAEDAKVRAEVATLSATNAMKSKQQFLSNMSHEIRTPMNAIIGFTKVVLKTELTAKQREYLSAIKISGDALIVLINDILDLAKVDAGKMTFEKTPFRLAASVTAMVHLFEMKIQEKNLQLMIDFDQAIPDTLVGDPVRLHQIIMNLVSNAVKFTSEGHIGIQVRLTEEDEDTVRIKFSVTDTGIGISETKISTVFENFQQATSSTSRLFGGTGLGLAIVKQLVEQQGGTTFVQSEVGLGSTFGFELSFSKTDAEAVEDAGIINLDEDMKHIKVLVVEDMPLNQLLMRTLLDDFGFERDIASNGKIAIEKMQSKSYDIILMDLQMPEMNGFEATEYIRNTMKSKIPIIALTADVTIVDVAKCKEVGMNDYLAKPVDERLLYSKIVSLVSKPAQTWTKLELDISGSDVARERCTDLGYLITRTKANPELMMEMIAIYLEQTPPLVSAMKQGLIDEDWQGVHAAVHKMIPSFSIMGIHNDFEQIAKKVQEFAGVQKGAEGIPGLILQLEQICLQACEELQEELQKMKTTKQ